jgi:anti-sigma regulatory factor (Ser/Thr protein kinase)
MTAHPVPQASGPAAGAAGWQWLHCAAQMAALASGRPVLWPAPGSATSPAGGRAGAGNGFAPASGAAHAAAAEAILAAPTAPDSSCFPKVAMRTPGIEPGSISAARQFTTLTLRRWGQQDRGDDVALVVSELLSNALRHGLAHAAGCRTHRPIRLGLLHSGPSIMCAVADPSDQMPVPREASWLDESGRGLHVIASLCDQWGSCTAPERPGKVVWATFAAGR